MVGGVTSIVGWLMPWSGVVFVSISGLGITIAALTGGVAALDLLRASSAGILLVCLGIFIATVFGAIPVLGFLCAKTGFELVENRSSALGQHVVSDGLDRVRSRAIKGFVLMGLIFLVPLVLSGALVASQPGLFGGLFALGQLGATLMPTGGYTSGFFVAIGGFILAYLGARLARSQISSSSTINESTNPLAPAARSFPDTWSSGLAPAQHGTAPPSLTEEERRILDGLAQGLTDADIAERLGISSAAMSMMILDLFGKFKVKNSTELVERAREIGTL
jgi:DNA-binding CsgD family transcriptional regulator